MIPESKTRRKHGVAFTMAQARKALYPYPTYQASFSDGTVARMSFWTRAGKPFDFDAGRRACEAHMGAPAIDGYVEHDVPGEPWVRIRDPHFSGETSIVAKPRINGIKLKKAALAVVEQSTINGENIPMIPPKALQDLREALNLEAA